MYQCKQKIPIGKQQQCETRDRAWHGRMEWSRKRLGVRRTARSRRNGKWSSSDREARGPQAPSRMDWISACILGCFLAWLVAWNAPCNINNCGWCVLWLCRRLRSIAVSRFSFSFFLYFCAPDKETPIISLSQRECGSFQAALFRRLQQKCQRNTRREKQHSRRVWPGVATYSQLLIQPAAYS